MASEVMGLIYGKYGGSSHVLDAGGLSYEASFMPHGGMPFLGNCLLWVSHLLYLESYETWKTATMRELPIERICEDTIAFMFHISVPFSITKNALEAKNLHREFSCYYWGIPQSSLTSVSQVSPPEMWDDVKPHFMDHIESINADLIAAGLTGLTIADGEKPSEGNEKDLQRTESQEDLVVVGSDSEEHK